ncbi:hypothetical protein A3F57_05065 [Candidatus Roizmanbacteria bacterium RIFCSPHIGHO2_12_FULL_36_11]|nr:MAG: hypothetical protein A3F57_05065 [Candidatus Roizmanbacteria bacterium RIFCSPHIGHO2_12_FULL_36_11]
MFDNWHRNKGNVGWGIEIPYNPRVDFRQFVDEFPNYQSRFVGNYRFRRSDIIGTTNKVNFFAGRIIAYLSGCQYQEIHVDKRNETNKKLTLAQLGIPEADQPEFLSQFEKLNGLDYDLWYEAQRLESEI